MESIWVFFFALLKLKTSRMFILGSFHCFVRQVQSSPERRCLGMWQGLGRPVLKNLRHSYKYTYIYIYIYLEYPKWRWKGNNKITLVFWCVVNLCSGVYYVIILLGAIEWWNEIVEWDCLSNVIDMEWCCWWKKYCTWDVDNVKKIACW